MKIITPRKPSNNELIMIYILASGIMAKMDVEEASRKLTKATGRKFTVKIKKDRILHLLAKELEKANVDLSKLKK